MRNSAVLCLAVSMLLLCACSDYESASIENGEMPQASCPTEIEAAEDWEIPDIRIADVERHRRIIFGEVFPRSSFIIWDGRFLAWSLNGQRLPDVCDEPCCCGRPGRVGMGSFVLEEGENELVIMALGKTGLVVEERLIIISDQTTPQELRPVPRVESVAISYDAEYSDYVTFSFTLYEGDYAEMVIAFSPALDYDPYSEPLMKYFDLNTQPKRVFEVTVNIRSNRMITLTTEGRWGYSTAGVDIRRTEAGPRIAFVTRDGERIGIGHIHTNSIYMRDGARLGSR